MRVEFDFAKMSDFDLRRTEVEILKQPEVGAVFKAIGDAMRCELGRRASGQATPTVLDLPPLSEAECLAEATGLVTASEMIAHADWPIAELLLAVARTLLEMQHVLELKRRGTVQ